MVTAPPPPSPPPVSVAVVSEASSSSSPPHAATARIKKDMTARRPRSLRQLGFTIYSSRRGVPATLVAGPEPAVTRRSTGGAGRDDGAGGDVGLERGHMRAQAGRRHEPLQHGEERVHDEGEH